MTTAELADEEKRFAADAASVEVLLAEEAKTVDRQHDLATLARRREHHEYWSELHNEQEVVV